MSEDTNLRQQLKKLKLSGILQSLEARILESQQNQLDYKTFLQLVLQDEIELRHTRKITRLIKQAKFAGEQVLEDFDTSLSTGIRSPQLRELATCAFIRRAEGIIFTGPPGTGKTHLAKALGHAACRKELTVRFFSFNELFRQLEKAELTEKLPRLMKQLIKKDLLIIDDFAFTALSQQQSEWLYEIVDARYGARSTILTSNRAMGDWLGVFPDPVIGGAVLDRLTHQAHQIQLKGESVRKKLGLKMLQQPVDNHEQ